jgi:glycine cleavage system regulatory protein
MTYEGSHLLKVSGIGQDRPGIIHKIANVVKDSKGNIVFQRSMKVAHEFAIMLIASFEADNRGGAQRVMREFNQSPLGSDFIVFAREFRDTTIVPMESYGTKYVITVLGDDRIGIVEAITLMLVRHDLNVDWMESEISYRPMQGTKTFSSTFEITTPDGFDSGPFFAELEQFENDTDLTILVKQR